MLSLEPQNYVNLIILKYLIVNNKNEGFGNVDVNWLCSSICPRQTIQ